MITTCGSTATVGSSKKISLGLWAIPQAMFNLRSKPPESCLGKNFLKSFNPTKLIASSTYCFLCFLSRIYKPQNN